MKETEALRLHAQWHGKIEISPVAPVHTRAELALAYTPGVADACMAIAAEPEQSFALTRRWNMVAVVTDGTAVLGLGDIGPAAAMPVMEGKCVLFKSFGGVDAFPVCLDTKDVDEIVHAVELLQPTFGGINLEDIAAPRCFEIERRLKERLSIPVFHDDQHGTAVVVAAGLVNALRVTERDAAHTRVVVNGAGAAGIAIAKLLLSLGVGELILSDTDGVPQRELAARTNPRGVRGTLANALAGADVFVGVSRPGLVTPEMVRAMAKDPIVFAMANPTPEIMPDAAKAGGARVVGTGRSDFPNQINNVLAFPGIFKGALAVRARDITDGMKMAAARAIAALVPAPDEEHILPDAFDAHLAPAVAEAVAAQARAEGLARA